jgi:hypothetical protein
MRYDTVHCSQSTVKRCVLSTESQQLVSQSVFLSVCRSPTACAGNRTHRHLSEDDRGGLGMECVLPCCCVVLHCVEIEGVCEGKGEGQGEGMNSLPAACRLPPAI